MKTSTINAKVRSHTIKEHNQGDTMLVEFEVYADDECKHAPNGRLAHQMPVAKALKEYPIGSCHYIALRGSQTEFDFNRPAEPKVDPSQGTIPGMRKGRANNRGAIAH